MQKTLIPAANTIKNISMLVLILFTATLVMCSSASATTNKTVVVIPKATLLHFWKIVCTGAAAATQGTDVKIIWRGPRVENKIDAQKHLINFYINQKVDAIVLAPTHENKLNESIEKAVAAGIKIVIIDSISTTKAKHSLIATNNYKAGQLGAKLLLDRITVKGPVLLMGNVPQSSSISAREQGFVDAVNQIDPGRTVVKINLIDGTRREAQMAADDILQCSKKIAGIFAVNEVSSEGVLHALNNHVSLDVPFVGVDYSHDLLNGIKTGQIDALITQTPYAMGYMGVKTAIGLINGTEIPSEMESPVKIVTKENIEYVGLLRCLKEITEEERKACPMCFN